MSKKSVETKKGAKTEPIRIMVFGTFDGLHEGHLNFFKQAKNFTKNSFLIVSIARDENVFKIKGKYPELTESQRMNLVKKDKNKLADKVVLSGIRDHIPHILKERPAIIALGYDQRAYVANLKKGLESRGLSVRIIRLKPYKENTYKNHLIKNKRQI
jgi:cytidyltransferase-like protein